MPLFKKNSTVVLYIYPSPISFKRITFKFPFKFFLSNFIASLANPLSSMLTSVFNPYFFNKFSILSAVPF